MARRQHVPFRHVPHALGVGEVGAGDEGDVAERGVHQRGEDRIFAVIHGARVLLDSIELGLGQRLVLLRVVLGVEMVEVDRLLPDDRIEEEPVLRHVPARRRARVTLGIDQRAALLRLDADAEPFRHEHLEPIEGPGLPVAVLEAEHVGAAEQRRDVDADRVLEVVLDQAEHLVRLDDLHRPLLEAVIVPELGDAAHMHAGHRRSAEVHRHAVGRAMVDRVDDPLPFRADLLGARSDSFHGVHRSAPFGSSARVFRHASP